MKLSSHEILVDLRRDPIRRKGWTQGNGHISHLGNRKIIINSPFIWDMLGPRREHSFIMPYPLSGYATPKRWMGPSTRAAWFTMRFVRDKWQRFWHKDIMFSPGGPQKCWEHVMNLLFLFIVVLCCCFTSAGGIWAAKKVLWLETWTSPAKLQSGWARVCNTSCVGLLKTKGKEGLFKFLTDLK